MRQKSLPLQQISITNMKQLSSEKVSLGEKLGYSLGDAAANLVFQMMMIFQLKFYTDVFGLDGAVAGSVLMIASISAIIVDPTVGILTDRTSTRWGKFRPWVLWTAIPFCLFYVLAFYNPGIEDKGMVATYATISYVLLMTVYSFNNVPYTSLGGVMTSVIRERTSITTIRFVVVTIAQFIDIPWVKTIASYLEWGKPLQTTLYVGMIIFFTYFYTAVTVKISDMAENLKKYGGFIPGIRPGQPTADYLDHVMTRITLAGSIFLAFIAVLPNMVAAATNIQGVYFGGTALLIVVGVALQTMKQIEAMIVMRHYEGFMK